MKPDDLERRLERQPLRQVPPGWREEILRRAGRRPAALSDKASPSSWVDRLRDRLRDWLWPHPVAWGGLAASWAVILALNAASDGAAFTRIQTPRGFVGIGAAGDSAFDGLFDVPPPREPAVSPRRPSGAVPPTSGSTWNLSHETDLA